MPISEPLYIILILLAVVIFAEKWSFYFRNAAVMRFIPTPVLCYIPPTILTTLGILPAASPVYDFISTYVLPACLVMLLMTTDLTGLKKVGQKAVIAMGLGIGSVILGAIAIAMIYSGTLGEHTWNAVGTITGSWLGGTVNMIAVKEATGLPEEVFTPLFISDITVVYVWMTFLMICSMKQKQIDRFLRADHIKLHEILAGTAVNEPNQKAIGAQSLALLLFIGFGVAKASIWLGTQVPMLVQGFTPKTWAIIFVTTVGLALSKTKVAKREEQNAARMGYFLLYLVLAGTGAKANLLAIFHAPIFLAIGFTWLFIHAAILLIGGRIFRIPSGLLATASQANLGGAASAPVVASTYEPKLVPVALILAIFGNAVGNYLGILTAQLIRSF